MGLIGALEAIITRVDRFANDMMSTLESSRNLLLAVSDKTVLYRHMASSTLIYDNTKTRVLQLDFPLGMKHLKPMKKKSGAKEMSRRKATTPLPRFMT